ncbi:MAG: SPOR domain-containing protein [Deltaproteobacteria bacterium]|nr:SPOR domain-containing protein [Deltaproteobacteria bacterium]
MKYLYNKKGIRRGEGERHQFAFFAIGAIVVLVAVFVIGLQVGRVVEKNAAPPEVRSGKTAPAAETRKSSAQAGAADIRKDLGAFSEDATKVPVVPPPDAKSAVNEVEKNLTFQETLARKTAEPVPLVRSAPADNKAAAEAEPARGGTGRKYLVQAGAFRDKAIADGYRKRLAKAGYAVKVVKGTGKDKEKLFRVLVGPFLDKEAARKTVRKLMAEMKIDAFLLAG